MEGHVQFDISPAQKRKFYSQELFDDHQHLKKYLCILIFVIGLCEILRTVLIESNRKGPTLDFTQRWVIYITMSGGVLLYMLSTTKYIETPLFKKIRARAVLLIISNLALSISVYFRTLWEVKISYTYRIENGCTSSDHWLDTLTLITTLTFGVVLTDVLYPTWAMKTLLPLAAFIGMFQFIIQHRPENEFVLLFRMLTSCLYFLALYIIKDMLRRKIFQRRMTDETWNRIQKQILTDIPTSIAILDTNQKKIIYVNQEFKKWSSKEGNDHFNFLTKVRNLVRRKDTPEYFKSVVDLKISPLDQSQNLDISPDIFSNINDGIFNNPSTSPTTFGKFRTNQPLTEFKSLADLAKDFLNQLNTSLDDDSDSYSSHTVVYDGVYAESPENIFSFEIKVLCTANNKVIIMLNDTTQRDLIVSLQSNNEYKDNLLASISHELRTPLNGILGFLEFAADSKETPVQIKEDFLVPALRLSKLQIHIINDILDYSRIGSNSLSLMLQNSSIVETIENCCSLLERQIQGKGLKLIKSIETDKIPAKFRTDHARVSQVLLNLIGNAIKFTFSGEIKLEVKMLEGQLLDISVTDTGIGMKEDEIERIFDKFNMYKGVKITENSTGVGFGLTVSQKIAKMLGPSGSQGLLIESEFGNGSKFSFTVQRKNKTVEPLFKKTTLLSHHLDDEEIDVANVVTSFDEYTGTATSPAKILNNGQKYIFPSFFKESFSPIRRYTSDRYPTVMQEIPLMMSTLGDTVNTESPPPARILIVDDDPFNILALESLLKVFNIHIEKAFNGKDAIHMMEKRNNLEEHISMHYKLVFMDFNMPVMDGRDATKKLRQLMKEGKIVETKIVGCTAFNSKEDIQAGLHSGMKEILTKPVVKEKLIDLLKRYFIIP